MSIETKKIRKAAALILNKGWCQGSLARLADGTSVWDNHPEAVSFCAIGALSRAGLTAYINTAAQAVEAPGDDLVTFNNAPDTKAEDVANALLLAAEILEMEP